MQARRRRVGIVDDHPAIALGLASVIDGQEGLAVTASGATVAELLERDDTIDIALLDLLLGDGSSPADNVRALKDRGIPVLIYTSGEQPLLVREAGRAGAMGMIRKSEEPRLIVAALLGVLNGEVAATPDWAAAIEGDDAFVSARLSAREAEVLALYASGETAERVARELFISRQTVLEHIRNVRAKYAAVDRPAPTKVDLYRRAAEDGLVEPMS